MNTKNFRNALKRYKRILELNPQYVRAMEVKNIIEEMYKTIRRKLPN
ncbi:MAG: hypothetical protein N2490_05760 [Ignavibacteria bacterium]|nr:hypothetical protein [Ignavibacteria bacterium]